MNLALLLALAFCPAAVRSPAVAERPVRSVCRATLEALSYVAGVSIAPAARKPKLQILHILDYHFVEEVTFATDIRDAAKADGVTLSDEAVAADWEDFIGDVEAVQAEQLALLRSLAKSHSLKAMHLEAQTGTTRVCRIAR